jgi:hypothetical protein
MPPSAAAESIAIESPVQQPPVVLLPGRLFVGACGLASLLVFAAGRLSPMPVWLLSAEVLATILGLFVFGSFRIQIHKNALTYGMAIVIVATFSQLAGSAWHTEIAEHGWFVWTRHHLLTFSGLDDLIHADTMLFILGLTLFVSVIAQTRVLEGVTFFLLRRSGGRLLPTVVSVTMIVALASGLIGGVSMIGLTIRTLVIVMMLAAAPVVAVRYAVMVCTAVTTICGVWVAYGEPPNLIMQGNLYPLLTNAFFLQYGVPVALASYLVVAWHLRSRLAGQRIDLNAIDVIDANAEDVRFLQASRHGEVMTPVELVEGHADALGGRSRQIVDRMQRGESLGLAMVHEDVPVEARRLLLGHFVSDELADGLDRHYLYEAAGRYEEAFRAALGVEEVLASMARRRKHAQRIGALAFIPFVVLLAAHTFDDRIPLFAASFAAFVAALPAIAGIPRMRALALHEAAQEYAEYYFLFPLFLSITLLTSAGFFGGLQTLVRAGVARLGHAHVAFAQFFGSTVLSAILDNNIVADFASRALHGFDDGVVRFFAMAQIAGYALGGCWTHIGCAQSVVAFAFIQRDVDEHYTPVQWIREMTPLMVQIMVFVGVLIYGEYALLRWIGAVR